MKKQTSKLHKLGKKCCYGIAVLLMVGSTMIATSAEMLVSTDGVTITAAESEDSIAITSQMLEDYYSHLRSDRNIEDVMNSSLQVDPLAEIWKYTPVEIRTTEGLYVTAGMYIGEPWTAEQIDQMEAITIAKHPNVAKVGDYSYNYNCHSFAWYDRSTSNSYWINNSEVEKFIVDSHTISVSIDSLQVGDIVVYKSYSGECLHSAIVGDVDSEYNNGGIICVSKWGDMGIYVHDIEDVPSSYTADGQEGTEFLYDFYRYEHGVHEYDENGGSDIVDKTASGHVLECVHCSTTIVKDHTFTTYLNLGITHSSRCNVCQYEIIQSHVTDGISNKCIYCPAIGPFPTTPARLKKVFLEESAVAIYDDRS